MTRCIWKNTRLLIKQIYSTWAIYILKFGRGSNGKFMRCHSKSNRPTDDCIAILQIDKHILFNLLFISSGLLGDQSSRAGAWWGHGSSSLHLSTATSLTLGMPSHTLAATAALSFLRLVLLAIRWSWVWHSLFMFSLGLRCWTRCASFPAFCWWSSTFLLFFSVFSGATSVVVIFLRIGAISDHMTLFSTVETGPWTFARCSRSVVVFSSSWAISGEVAFVPTIVASFFPFLVLILWLSYLNIDCVAFELCFIHSFNCFMEFLLVVKFNEGYWLHFHLEQIYDVAVFFECFPKIILSHILCQISNKCFWLLCRLLLLYLSGWWSCWRWWVFWWTPLECSAGRWGTCTVADASRHFER